MLSTSTRHEWTAPDGARFPYSVWDGGEAGAQASTPSRARLRPRALLVCVHGLSGAAVDFEPLGAHFLSHDILTYALELRGQGSDPDTQRRGDLAKIEDWYADLSAFFAMVRQQHPGMPVYLYGESMGAALLVRFLAQARAEELPAGLILASPVVAIGTPPSWLKRQLFRFVNWLNPVHRVNLRKAIERDRDNPAKWVTRNEEHRLWFQTAPHRIESFTVRFFLNLYDLIAGCGDAAPLLTTPVLVAYAANDIFIPPAMVEEFFAHLGSRDKELLFFPESYHLLLHDEDQAEVLAQMERWLAGRMGGEGAPSGLTA